MKLHKVKNIRDMINKIDPGSDLADRVEEGAKKRSFSMMLVRMRVNAGMTQQDMANALGISQSRISKLEMSENDYIGVQHLIDYGRVTGFGAMQGDPASGKEVVLTFSFA